MELWDLVEPLGIATYILIVILLLTGMRIVKVKRPMHKVIGIITFIVATLHGAVVLLSDYL